MPARHLWRVSLALDADRRGADLERVRGRLEVHRHRSVHGVEHRQQRQLHLQHHRRGVGNQRYALESLETSFHQDLNGDGMIGVPSATVIESLGSTSLVQVGNNFYLDNIGSGYGTRAEICRRGMLWRVSLALDADRRGADRQAGTRSPGSSPGPISTRCGAPTATATIISNIIGAVSGTSATLGIARDELPPGPERRWGDRRPRRP